MAAIFNVNECIPNEEEAEAAAEAELPEPVGEAAWAAGGGMVRQEASEEEEEELADATADANALPWLFVWAQACASAE